MNCEMCGRLLKGAESLARGYGPVCYRKIMLAAPRRKKAVSKSNDNYNHLHYIDYNVPGQMELSDFIEMPEQKGKTSD